MSIKRVYYVKAARQTYAKDSTTTRTIEVLRKDGTPKMGRGGRPMTRRVSAPDHSRPLPLQTCSKCGDTIQVGQPYRYWEPYFRSSYKKVRCMKQACTPRPSELESSAMSSVLAVIEDVQATDISSFTEAQEFSDLAQQVADALDEVIEQYRDAGEAFGGAGQNAERADELESSKDEIENVSFEDAPDRDDLDSCNDESNKEQHDPDHDDDEDLDTSEWVNLEGCDACDTIYDEALQLWRDDQESILSDALSNIG